MSSKNELQEEKNVTETQETLQEMYTVDQKAEESRNQSQETRFFDKFQPIKSLKFSGMRDLINPKFFIENFENVAAQEEMDENEKQNYFIQSLIKYAAIWLEEHEYKNYEEMKEAFLKFYWNSDIQKNFVNHLEVGKYEKKSGLTMTKYFFKYAYGAKFLDEAPTEKEIINKLSKHFGCHVEKEFQKKNVQSIEEAVGVLITAFKQNVPTRSNKNIFSALISSKNSKNSNTTSYAWFFLSLACCAIVLNFVTKFYSTNEKR